MKRICYSIAIFAACVVGAGAGALQPKGTAAKTSNAKKSTTGGLSQECRTCLGLFSAESLSFTSNRVRCTSALTQCTSGSREAAKCESVIDSCFENNCARDGACMDELANRRLFSGCLKEANLVLPYVCADKIAGKASSYAFAKNEQLQDKERGHQMAMNQQSLSAQVAAAQATGEAEKIRAQAEAQQSAAQMALQQQAYENEQNAILAAQAREKADAAEKRASRPNVAYSNIVSNVKTALSSVRMSVSQVVAAMGIQKGEAKSGNMLVAASPSVSVPGYPKVSDPKARAFIIASKYKDGGTFRCTRDVREDWVKFSLLEVQMQLAATRDWLVQQISHMEMLNADAEDAVSSGRPVSEAKIDALYEMQNSIASTLATMEADLAMLDTDCETRCGGTPAVSLSAGGGGASSSGPGISYDEKGNIVFEDPTLAGKGASGSAGGYECAAMSPVGGLDLNMIMNPGAGTAADLFGGGSKKATILTERVLRAVVNADRGIEYAEIAATTGRALDTEESEGGAGKASGAAESGTDVGSKCMDVYNVSTEATPNAGVPFAECVNREIGIKLDGFLKEPRRALIKKELQDTINQALDLLSAGAATNADCNFPCCTGSSLDLKETANTVDVQVRNCMQGIAERVKYKKASKNDESSVRARYGL